MDAPDLLVVMEWMMPRWTEVAAWEAAEWKVFGSDLAGYTAGQVLTGLHRLWRNGRERAPRAGSVLAMLTELGERPRTSRPQLPAEVTAPTVSLREYAEDHFGSMAAMFKAIREGVLL